MEDFGYIKNKEKDSHIIKKAFLLGAAVFSIVCFVYITISAYYSVYHDPKNEEIEVIKSPDHEIKIIADETAEKNLEPRRAIYEDVFGDGKSTNNVQNPNFPKEPILPPEEEKQLAVLENENLAPITNKQTTKSEPKTIKAEEKTAVVTEKPQQNTPKKSGKIVKVQIGAFNSNETANSYFARLRSNHQTLFSSRKSYVMQVNIPAKGTFYRLQIGDFSDQIAAENFCKQFIVETKKKSKSDCILVE